MGLTLGGLASALLIGVPCMVEGDEEAYSAGIAFLTIGDIAFLSGIPIWCIGSSRMKKSNNNVRFSVGGTHNGAGLRVNF